MEGGAIGKLDLVEKHALGANALSSADEGTAMKGSDVLMCGLEEDGV